MKIKMNLPQGPQKPFDPVPPGWYEAEIIEVTRNEASTGTPYLNVEFEIMGHPTQERRHVWANLYLTDRGEWKLHALLNALGMDPQDEFDTDELTGARVRIRVKEARTATGDVRSEAVSFRKSFAHVPF